MALTVEQIEQRRHLLTASDIAAVVGVNPFHSPLNVWIEKVDGKTREDTWRSKRGQAVEDLILQAASQMRAVRIARSPITLVHPNKTWLGATPDGVVVDGEPAIVWSRVEDLSEQPVGPARAVVEAKDVGLRVAHHWNHPETEDPIVPDYVMVQTQVQLTVVRAVHPEASKAIVGAWLPYEEEPRIYDVAHDPELEHAILEVAERFWFDNVLAKKPPKARSAEEQIRILKRLFPKPTKPEYLPSSVEFELLAQQFIEAREAKKAAEARMEQLEASFIEKIADWPGVDGHGWKAHYKHREGYEKRAHFVKPGRVFDLRVSKKKKSDEASASPLQEETVQ